MSRPYWSGGRSRGGNTYADDGDPALADHSDEQHSLADDHLDDGASYAGSSYGRPSYQSGYSGYSGSPDTGSAYDEDATELLDFEDYEYRDTRWRWIAGAAAAVLFIAVVAIATVLGNDSATSTSSSTTEANDSSAAAQDSAPATSRAPRTVIATPPPGPGPAMDLAPETVVTVTPTPSAVHPAPEPPPPPLAEAPAADRTITYTVTGERQLFDLVTIIYTDEQGFPRTEINAALPWTRTVALNPGVQTQSVTATSVTGKLNCAITDGNGETVIAQNNNTLITTCTK